MQQAVACGRGGGVGSMARSTPVAYSTNTRLGARSGPGALGRLQRASAVPFRRMRVSAIAEAEKLKSVLFNTGGTDTSSDIEHKLKYVVGKRTGFTPRDVYQGTAWSVRDHLFDNFHKTHEYWRQKDPKFVYYLSAEFLMGRTLTNAVGNLHLEEAYGKALRQMGTDLEAVQEQEQNAALGNGGLGRLAACFLDSIATLDLPGWGYGIRYRYGMFKQQLSPDGYQVEVPDIWLTNGNPWEARRGDIFYEVAFGGKTETSGGKTIWKPAEKVKAVAFDNPIPGYKTTTTTNLRLWDAEPFVEFDLTAFNAGDYEKAVLEKDQAMAITAVLYPNDSTPEGKELRLKQQFFFVSASLQDVIARFKTYHTDWEQFPEKACFQMNDTHPTIAVAELLRILVDVEGLDWEKAWNITSKCVNYTNHTVMPEALEKWPVKVLAKMLPRHMEIIEIINSGWTNFLEETLSGPTKKEKITAMSIVQENPWVKNEMLVNMAYLAVVSSSAVNGVAAIHSEIVKNDIFNDFYQLFPEKFQNKTNGVTPRRWLAYCNPELSELITSALGTDKWISDTFLLEGLHKFAEDPNFRTKWRAVKRQKKAKLAELIKSVSGDDDINLDALFDIQVKRMHEYKRQHLNVFSIIYKYMQLKQMSPAQRAQTTPRVCVIGGKAASAYDMAKRMIHLVCKVGEKINNDPDTKEYLRLYFLPDYNVSLAETIIPASELSQHISTAGTEASGTSNMKFQMNGCLIIGTMDGANIEIAEETGQEYMFVFGVDAEDVPRLRKERKNFKTDPRWDKVLGAIEDGMFGDKEYFKPLVDGVNNMKVGNDWFLLANDFATYMDAQTKVDKLYADYEEWTKWSIYYAAASGKFSSDRTIVEYAKDIWHVKPCKP